MTPLGRQPKHRAELRSGDVDVLEGRWHVGRYWPGMFPHVEQGCPCPKAPCGLAAPIAAVPCDEHHGLSEMRQAHPAEECGRVRRRRMPTINITKRK